MVTFLTCETCGCSNINWDRDCYCEQKNCGCYVERTDDWSEYTLFSDPDERG